MANRNIVSELFPQGSITMQVILTMYMTMHSLNLTSICITVVQWKYVQVCQHRSVCFSFCESLLTVHVFVSTDYTEQKTVAVPTTSFTSEQPPAKHATKRARKANTTSDTTEKDRQLFNSWLCSEIDKNNVKIQLMKTQIDLLELKKNENIHWNSVHLGCVWTVSFSSAEQHV